MVVQILKINYKLNKRKLELNLGSVPFGGEGA